MMIVFVFFWFAVCLSEKRHFDAALEPGRGRQDYDRVEEVRGHWNETTTEIIEADEHLLREAILDVAYYLRRFKFGGYDPRYLALGDVPKQNLFVEFPSPPLRSIHWEVRKNCEPSFVTCVKYLQEQVSQTVLPRHLDSLTIAKQNGWSFVEDKDLIKSTDDECLKLLESDEKTFEVFSGPLQRFQWLVSASYYMCFFTMKESPYLKSFAEDCDNFGACISWDLGFGNRDVRADNGHPFACASYSFCPDPCCPLKFLPDLAACSDAGPCSLHSPRDETCLFSLKDNVDFEAMTLNKWNVSCTCDRAGTRWESKSGTCVDIDECVERESACDFPTENCRNLPGSYKCVCNPLGYRSDPRNQSCERDEFMQNLLNPPRPIQQNESVSFSVRFREIFNKLRSFVSTSVLPSPAKKEKKPNHTET